ncbi:coatomer subunit epsilon-2 [Lolium perenne]|uniref:coatomer subunit epsilon-2 n=2 Tax=Lolium TaxID=4520 RepID=UPI0021F5DEEE|nr:coatomer subunit epsilon-2-like [Lolium perenne]
MQTCSVVARPVRTNAPPPPPPPWSRNESMTSTSPDHLFGLRNSFYVGAYQAAITGSQSVPAHALSPDEVLHRDAILYRSYIAIGSHQLVIDEIGPAAATPLQAVKLLALYLSGGAAGNKESAVSRLKELLGDPAVGSNLILRLVAGTIFMHEQDYAEALKHTNSGGNMELLALNVQIYLQMHRPDNAEKQLRVMQKLDEDHTLTQLASAWLHLVMGGSKIQEAYLIFQDFSEKYTATCMILNGKAQCLMHMGNFEQAEGLLLESLNKDPKDAQTLANITVCSLKLGKPASRYLNQLKLAQPEHVLVKRMSAAEDTFDRASQAMA